MDTFVEISFQEISPEQSGILIAHLSELGFDGFEETATGLKAYINQTSLERKQLNEITASLGVVYSERNIPPTNWNREWESNFLPVFVGNFVAVRAGFHKPVTDVTHEIVITPKMSFGTGHHATTSLMIEHMEAIDFTRKSVMDFGTGTGILAILAEKLGADKITGVDNDQWSIENASENARENNCEKIKLKLSDVPDNSQRFDIILANINRNVILSNIQLLYQGLMTGGLLLISGILREDQLLMESELKTAGFVINIKTSRDNWLFFKVSRP